MRSVFVYLLGILVLGFAFPIASVHASVVINEFQIEPSGASQWIELYNTGPESQDVSGWFVDDNGGTEKFTIPQGSVLGLGNCISFSSGNFNWNTTSSDSARLINGATTADEYSFSSSPGTGVSFGRNPDGTGGFTTYAGPTQNALNINGVSCIAPPTPTPTPTPTSAPTPTRTPTPTKTPTPVHTPTPIPTSTIALSAQTPSKTPIPTKKSTNTPTPTSRPATLGETTKSAEVLSAIDLTPETESTPAGSESMRALIVSLLLIGLGLALLSILFIWKKRKAMMPKEEQQ